MGIGIVAGGAKSCLYPVFKFYSTTKKLCRRNCVAGWRHHMRRTKAGSSEPQNLRTFSRILQLPAASYSSCPPISHRLSDSRLPTRTPSSTCAVAARGGDATYAARRVEHRRTAWLAVRMQPDAHSVQRRLHGLHARHLHGGGLAAVRAPPFKLFALKERAARARRLSPKLVMLLRLLLPHNASSAPWSSPPSLQRSIAWHLPL